MMGSAAAGRMATASFYRRQGKRLLDLGLTLPALVVLAPVVAGVAIAVRVGLGSPVLFRHRRPGLGGRPFVLYKFRTMNDAADAEGRPLPDAERLTAVGRFLRRASLDELPTLFNVLLGDMSLVGPRPLLMEYLPRYSARHARRHEVRPGVTGLAQVEGRHTLKFSERLEFDVKYAESCSFGLDVRILFRTVAQLVRGDGVADEQMGYAAEIDDVGLYFQNGAPIEFVRGVPRAVRT